MNYLKKSTEELLREEQRLKEKYDEIEEQCLKDGKTFSEFEKTVESVAEGLYFIDKVKRLRKDPIVEYGKEWKGETMTLTEFVRRCKSHEFIDEDGVGYYATETSKSDVEILPSDVEENLIREDFSHVIWFSK